MKAHLSEFQNALIVHLFSNIRLDYHFNATHWVITSATVDSDSIGRAGKKE